jgi:formamidopyrimidine-DNA glycosylase
VPELPEVETIKNTLEKYIKNTTIVDCKVFYGGNLKTHTTEDFIKEIKNKKIKGIFRRGKYLKIILNTGSILLIHLRMTGNLIICTEKIPVKKHTHIIIYLNTGRQIRYIDIRKFGTWYLVSPEQLNKIRGYRLLGPEPFDKDFTLDYFKNALNSKKNIKNLLLEQTVVAGIGNIYADEILFTSGIKPFRQADTLHDNEIKRLYSSIKKELTKGIKNRGTSFSDYVDGIGEKGKNQNFLNVYQLQGTKCSRCGTIINKSKIGGRSCHYCPNCQE